MIFSLRGLCPALRLLPNLLANLLRDLLNTFCRCVVRPKFEFVSSVTGDEMEMEVENNLSSRRFVIGVHMESVSTDPITDRWGDASHC